MQGSQRSGAVEMMNTRNTLPTKNLPLITIDVNKLLRPASCETLWGSLTLAGRKSAIGNNLTPNENAARFDSPSLNSCRDMNWKSLAGYAWRSQPCRQSTIVLETMSPLGVPTEASRSRSKPLPGQQCKANYTCDDG